MPNQPGQPRFAETSEPGVFLHGADFNQFSVLDTRNPDAPRLHIYHRERNHNCLITAALNRLHNESAIGTNCTLRLAVTRRFAAQFSPDNPDNLGPARQAVGMVMSTADAIYRSTFPGFGLQYNLSELAVYTDPPRVQGDAQLYLHQVTANFERVAQPPPDDRDPVCATHVFDVGDFGRTAGIAYVDTAGTREGFGLTLTADIPSSMIVTTHELGHNFGAGHPSGQDERGGIMEAFIDDTTYFGFMKEARRAIVQGMGKMVVREGLLSPVW